MSDNKKTRNPRFVTDTGIAIYPALIEPDTKFDAEGVYKVKLRLSPDAEVSSAKGEKLGSIETFFEAKAEEAIEMLKEREGLKKPKKAEMPFEVDDETGDLLVNFKLKATVTPKGKDPFEQKPVIYDSKGNLFDGDRLWGGSKIKVAFEIIPFYTKLIGAGVTLRMKAVQVIEANEGGAVTAEEYGFAIEESDEDGDNPFSPEEGGEDEGNGDF